MSTVDKVLRAIVGLTGAFQVVVGIAIWMGYALPLIPLHMAVGLAFVLALWILAVRAILARAGRGIAACTLAWGALVIAFGMAQAQILPGEHHWVIRLLHLLVGLTAMRLADVLARRIRRERSRFSPTLDASTA